MRSTLATLAIVAPIALTLGALSACHAPASYNLTATLRGNTYIMGKGLTSDACLIAARARTDTWGSNVSWDCVPDAER